MNFENDISVFGDILSHFAIKNKPFTHNIVFGATSTTDKNVDFNLSNVHVIDFSGLDLSGGGINVNINLINGSTDNVNQRLIVRNLHTGTNIVTVTLRAFTDETLTTTQIIENVSDIETQINVLNSVNVIDFKYDGIDTYHYDSVASYSENTTYSNNNVLVNGESYNQSLSNIDDVLGKLIPDGGPIFVVDYDCLANFGTNLISNFKNLENGNIQTNLTGDTNVRLSIKEFRADDNSPFTYLLDDSQQESIDTSLIGDPPQSITQGEITLNKTVFNNFYNQHDGELNISLIGSKEQRKINVGFGSNGSLPFYITKIERPIPTTPELDDSVVTQITSKICGIPVLRLNSLYKHNVNFKDVSYVDGIGGFYPSVLGYISSNGLNSNKTINADTFSNMNTNKPHSGLINGDITIDKANVFDQLTYQAVSTSGQTNVSISKSTDRPQIDTITNDSLFGIDHNIDMKSGQNATLLMNYGGIVSYPFSVTVFDGTGNVTLNDAITGERQIEITHVMNNESIVSFELSNIVGFSNSAIESNTGYRIEIERSDKIGETYNGNSAYGGIGVVGDNDGCLEVSKSTQHKKVFTFGEVVNATITIRILLNETSNHKFSQNIITDSE